MKMFKNPIIPGFYPDPSICRVEDDYYLVTSSFEYFPGVPIFHSKDLVNWKQIGHVLDRPEQLNLDQTPNSRGIYAPTIRYHQGTFYMITTFVVSQTGARRNFYVTATDPAGPWSDPVWLEGAPGIDPSLLFDDDGKVYYTGNRKPPSGRQYKKHNEIWLQELDLEKQQLVGPTYSLWDGALKNAHAQESPHLYKIGEWYYLIIAEGGTGHTHAVTIARSKHVTGPYEMTETNPILTHRHLGRNHPIVNVGHADIVQTQDGDWWMVCLASRPYGGYYRNLGRETFLVPFVWEDGWPIVNPGQGKIESEMPFPKLKEHKWPALPACDSFEAEQLDDRWNFLRTPRGEFWSVTDRPGYLRLKAKKETIMEEENPAFVGRRQQHIDFVAQTVMEFEPKAANESAGLVLLQNHDYQFRLEVLIEDDQQVIQLVRREAGEDQVLAKEPMDHHRVFLKVEAVGQAYSFFYTTEPFEWRELAVDTDGRILSTDLAGGFIGAYIGLYCSGNGQESDQYADFDWFEYQGTESE
ncbi:glycoside hydrolase family 43 protein [Gracilibacillus caseinilyticus]|uniref:Glycoside hydrolase family 43 protein n=1 Tax=Gracilibacillus caseinilyticus TaxID=2932256 RepID=A0ABY4F0J6_9BACI|nr:glycoside hydrolase family 43 protein [Gracilibacillus caseinilyticus]UOQ50038.1 glycoside hydrolase family 43 protein [Gracilibacillus caseinilyticus]